MATYCTQCKEKIGFFSYKYREIYPDGSIILLCKKCRTKALAQVHNRFKPFHLSTGYTRIKAVLALQLWQIPQFCVICGSLEDNLSKIMISLNNGSVNMSIPIYSCRYCSKHDLNPLEFIRYNLDSNNLTLDIGNPDVAEKYLAFLNSELSTIKHNMKTQTDPVDFIVRGSAKKISVPAAFMRDWAEKLGVQEIKKIIAGDADFQD